MDVIPHCDDLLGAIMAHQVVAPSQLTIRFGDPPSLSKGCVASAEPLKERNMYGLLVQELCSNPPDVTACKSSIKSEVTSLCRTFCGPRCESEKKKKILHFRSVTAKTNDFIMLNDNIHLRKSHLLKYLPTQ